MDTDNAKELSDDHKEKFEWLKQLILIHIDIDTGRSKVYSKTLNWFAD